ncbi:MAG: methyltransferase [Candidatus Thermoplasmatota archaeon]|nr:methyltransferase [Candidatus Thermoplasmatota archaeon]
MKAPYVSVPVEEADTTIRKFLSQGLVNKALKMKKNGNRIKIPVLESAYTERLISGTEDFEERYVMKSPYANALQYLESAGKKVDLPRSWTKLGNSVFFRTDDKKNVQDIAEAISLATNSRNAYLISGRIIGKERTPSVKLVYGLGGEITHRENGILYRFDPEKIMYSPGNVSERINASEISATNSVVWDMFSGIGYFSLPVLKYGNPRLVYCTDINPVAIRYLRINADLNHVGERLRAFVMDCFLFVPQEKPDLIIMGNFDAVRYLPYAETYIRSGGRIILHHIMDHGSEKSSERAGEIIASYMKRKFSVNNHRVVKSYSPRKWHVVTDLTVF